MYQKLFIYFASVDHTSMDRLSTTPTWIVCLSNQHGSSVDHTSMDRLSTTPAWIVCLPHQHGSSVYHTSMDRLSTTPTWIVCLPHQHGSSVYHTNMDRLSITPTWIFCLHQHEARYVMHAIFSQIGPSRRIDCLTPLCEYRREMSFPRTQRYIDQFRNRTDPTTNNFALLSIELHLH